MKKQRGMTLVELLISLAIIGIMTAIALPLFSGYQKKSDLDNDIRSFVSLVNYARALQNNPDNASRTSGNEYNYVIKIINNGSVSRAALYSSANPSNIIDKVELPEKVEVKFQNGNVASGDNLTISFTGLPPKETITCSVACDQRIEMILTTKGINPYTKTAVILNTNDALDQFFAVSIK